MMEAMRNKLSKSENLLDGSATQFWAAGLVLAIALLCVYWPVFTSDYLYYDDWIHFNARSVGCTVSPTFHWHLISGRPLQGYALCGLFHILDRTGDAWISRLIILSGIILFAVLQWMYFRALGLRWITAVCFALGTSVLPGMLVIGYWITAGSIIPALVATTTAALLTQAAIASGGTFARKVALLAGACALQVIALLNYQTEAMYFWTLTAVMLAVQSAKGVRAVLRSLATYTLVGVVPMAGYFIWFTWISGWATELKRTEPLRGTMFTQLPYTAKWFLEKALPRAASLWWFDLPRGFGVAVLALFTVCLIVISMQGWRISRRQGDRVEGLLRGAYPVAMMAMGLLSFSPMLVTAFNARVFRSMVPLSGFMFLVGAIHLAAVARVDLWPQRVKLCLAGGFALCISCLASGSLATRMVLPAAAEYSFVRNSLLGAARTGSAPGGVHAIIPLVTHELYTDEFNGLSAQSGQVLRPMIQVLAGEVRLPVSATSFSLPGEPLERAGSLIIDFAELSRSGLWRSVRTGDPPDPHSMQLITERGYNVFAFRGLIYGVPLSLGPVRLEDEPVDKLPGVITGTVLSDVLRRLGPVVSSLDTQPRLLSSHERFNLVAFRGRVYGVPWAAGALSLEDWTSGRVDKLPGVVIGANADDVLSRLPK
jgi:hypothetical protein